MGDTMFFKGTKIQNPRKSRKNIYLCSLKSKTRDFKTRDKGLFDPRLASRSPVVPSQKEKI